MSKKIIAGALSVATAVSAFAVLAVPAFAAVTPTPGWQEVRVAPEDELVLGGAKNNQLTMQPSLLVNGSNTTGGLTIQSTGNWSLQWVAVGGAYGAANTTPVGAGATTLGTSGFTTGTSATGYAYNGLTAATAGSANTWGVSWDDASANVLESTYALTGDALSALASGGGGAVTLTPTYSSSMDGNLGTDPFFGTIYFLLSPTT